MKRPFAILLATVILGACAPNAAPRLVADEPASEIVGFPDDPQALEAFVAAVAARSDVPIPGRVVSRSTQGGALYPRLTLLYMSAPDWCGSGGCTLFVLVPGDRGLVAIGRITLVRPPVLVLDTQTNGMPDIVVRVRDDYYPGKGEKFVVLPFDGHTYASNPTMPPARLVSGSLIEGEIAIPEGDTVSTLRR